MATVSEWLKNTIPGIVVLGAVGSILAALLIWLAKRMLAPVWHQWLVNVISKAILHFVKPASKQFVRLHFLPGEHKVQAFYALQITKLCIALFVVTWGIILFGIALIQSAPSLFRSATMVPLIVSFLGLWYALRCLAVILVPLHIDIEKMIADATAKALAKRKSKNDETATASNQPTAGS